MKTLINKANPEIRVTAPEIRVGSDSYYLKTDGHYGFIFRKIRWTLVEEEPEVDLEEEVEMEWESFNKHVAEYGEESEDVVWLNWLSFVDVARHFYELGRKGGGE